MRVWQLARCWCSRHNNPCLCLFCHCHCSYSCCCILCHQGDTFLAAFSRSPLMREGETLTLLDLSENRLGDNGSAVLAATLAAAGQSVEQPTAQPEWLVVCCASNV